MLSLGVVLLLLQVTVVLILLYRLVYPLDTASVSRLVALEVAATVMDQLAVAKKSQNPFRFEEYSPYEQTAEWCRQRVIEEGS